MPKLRRRRRLPGRHYYRPGRQSRKSIRRQLWGKGGKEFFRLIRLDQLGRRTKCANTIPGKQLWSFYVCMWTNWYTHLNKRWTWHQKYIKAWADMCVCLCHQHQSEDTIPPPGWLILHKPVPLRGTTTGGPAICCSGLVLFVCLFVCFTFILPGTILAVLSSLVQTLEVYFVVGVLGSGKSLW